MTQYNPELLKEITSGAIGLADSALKGSEWLGNKVLDPKELVNQRELVIVLGPRLQAARKSILKDAKSLGIPRHNLVDPFEERRTKTGGFRFVSEEHLVHGIHSIPIEKEGEE